MAQAVSFREFTPHNSRDDLVRKVGQAPVEHAEAVLAAYDLLQRLHEKGLIDLLNGLLSAGDTVVDRVVDVVSSKQMVTVLRLALIFGDLLTSIDADKLHDIVSNSRAKAPSLLEIAKQAISKDARRSMAMAVGIFNVLGDALNAQNSPHMSKKPYEATDQRKLIAPPAFTVGARALPNGRPDRRTIRFAEALEAKLTYALESAEQSSPVRVRYAFHDVTVVLSKDQVRIWGAESEVGVYSNLDIGSAGSLDVTVEKDFACLDRSDDENEDTFASPHAGGIC